MSEHPVVESIYRVVSEGAEVTEEQTNKFGKELSDLIANRLRQQKAGERRKFTLRMSNVGKGARQLWYESRFQPNETIAPHTLIKFMFGDILETLLLFLTRVGGHSVTHEQDEVDVNGIKGHIDADIDGVTVDVKSASTFSFRKFKDGTLAEDDPFGYVDQLAGYCEGRGTDGAFLAIDKQNGHVTYLPYAREDLAAINIGSRIDYLKEVIASDVEPERCYQDQEDGASGNRKLGVNCSYCAFKDRCWSDANDGLGLRTFLYSNGPRFLTKVAREPNVPEATF